jgi:hypothetical protein
MELGCETDPTFTALGYILDNTCNLFNACAMKFGVIPGAGTEYQHPCPVRVLPSAHTNHLWLRCPCQVIVWPECITHDFSGALVFAIQKTRRRLSARRSSSRTRPGCATTTSTSPVCGREKNAYARTAGAHADRVARRALPIHM